jgi:putative Flp pilus-assembly TadE/G-like protein
VALRSRPTRASGQALPLFALSLMTIIMFLGLAIDAGYAFSQNRKSQNAADFASMAGTRIVGEYNVGNSTNGTAATVYQAVLSELTAHNATLVSAAYVNAAGTAIPGGDIKTLGTAADGGNYGTIPVGAMGVVVHAKMTWRPFLLAAVGITSWTATTSATSVTAGQSLGGGVLPVGVSATNYGTINSCPVTNINSCLSSGITSQDLPPGSFGWLSFGANGSCPGSQLGMDTSSGCGTSQGFLDGQVGPPSDSYGCCTSISTSHPAGDIVAVVPGNKWADLSYYVANQIAIWVPIYDTTGSQGSNAYVHVVGFAPIIFVGEDTQHGKWLTGAAVSGVGCPGSGNTTVTGYSYTMCSAPGGAITLGATGGVRLVH